MAESRIILGIDPGFGRMGFGCVQIGAGRQSAIDYGIVSTNKEDEFAARLLQLHDDLDSIFAQHKPHIVGVEKLYFAKNTTTAMRVAEARGIVLLLCAKYGAHVVEYTPSQIKKAVTGDGGADKKAMQWMVKELLNLKQVPKIDDAADALAVALTAAGAKWET